MAEIEKGEIEQAFYLTQPPPHKPRSPAALRQMLEVQTNSGPDFTAPGSLSGFALAEYVRLLQLAGDSARIELLTLNGWGYQGGGYQATLTYRIQTSLARFHLLITVQSRESQSADAPGRHWSVNFKATYPINPSDVGRDPIQFTEEGKALVSLWNGQQPDSGESVAQAWLGALRRGQTALAYLLSSPPREREHCGKVVQAGVLLLTGGPLALPPGVSWKDLQDWQNFLRGDRIKANKDTFWAAKDEKREAARKEVIALLTSPRGLQSFKAARTPVHLFTREGERMIVPYDFQLVFRNEAGPMHIVEVQLILSAQVQGLGQQKTLWQVDRVELLRTRDIAPRGAGGQGG